MTTARHNPAAANPSRFAWRHLLLCSSSALALNAVLPPAALADAIGGGSVPTRPPLIEPICDGTWSGRVRGGSLRLQEDPGGGLIEWLDLGLGNTGKLDFEDDGQFAEARVEWDRCTSDIAIDFSMNRTDYTASGNNPFGGAPLLLDDNVEFETLDIEYGIPVTPNIRAHTGLRVLNYDSDTTYSGFFSDSARVSTEFLGAGPAAGIGFEAMLTPDGWGVFAGASAAYLFGKSESNFSYLGGGIPPERESKDTGVLNLEAELGVTRRVGRQSEFSAGVLYRSFQDIDYGARATSVSQFPNAFLAPNSREDRDFVGIFVGFETRF